MKRIENIIYDTKDKISKLLKSSEHGRLLKEGMKIVICGKPNVGKSSLLNVLLRQPRAIVSEIAGTTRDTIEETAQIKDIPFQLIDTAGILDPRDLIEEEAVKRSHMNMESADLVLFVLDGNQPLSQEDETIIEKIKGQSVIVINNKCDLKQKLEINKVKKILNTSKVINTSALKRKGIENLEELIVESVWHNKNIDTHSVFISNLRHVQALQGCEEVLEKASKLINDKVSIEFVSEEIKLAVNFLDAITGRNVDSDLIDQIFSQFCIGK